VLRLEGELRSSEKCRSRLSRKSGIQLTDSGPGSQALLNENSQSSSSREQEQARGVLQRAQCLH
jgi:hypothetical protein